MLMLQIEENMVHLSDSESSENVCRPKEHGEIGSPHANACTEATRPLGETPEDKQKEEPKEIAEDLSSVSCKCNCHISDKNCSFDSKMIECAKFREILLIHLDLIEQQDNNLQKKDKRIQLLKTENDQLTARINRMERRVALKARRSTTKDDFDVEGESGKSKANEQKRSSSTQKVKNPSVFAVTSKQGKDAGTGMYLKTDFNYLHTTNYSSFEKRIAEKLPVIQVPTWKDVSVESMGQSDNDKNSNISLKYPDEEKTDDESYLRRHFKLEIDEIRRKRWDLQQMRQERMQESLKQRQKNRDDPKSSGSTSSRPNEILINSLHPSSGNVMALEIADEVPVFALGSRVPQLEPNEFELPWFDVAKREIFYRQRSDRNKTTKKTKKRSSYRY